MKQHTRPCKSCPFLKANAGMLTAGRAEEIADDLLADKHFICHKTVKSLGGDGSERICAGSMIVTERSEEQPSQMARVAMRLGILDFDKIEKSADVPCFDDFYDFMDGHRLAGKKH